MANYINQIQVGSTVYEIGMLNSIHFDGLSPISTWYSDDACTTKATEASLS